MSNQPELPFTDDERPFQPSLPFEAPPVRPVSGVIHLPPFTQDNQIYIEPIDIIRAHGPEYALSYVGMIMHIAGSTIYSRISDAQAAVMLESTVDDVRSLSKQGFLPQEEQGGFDPRVVIAHRLYPGLGRFALSTNKKQSLR